jgi:hypothetical protein
MLFLFVFGQQFLQDQGMNGSEKTSGFVLGNVYVDILHAFAK